MKLHLNLFDLVQRQRGIRLLVFVLPAFCAAAQDPAETLRRHAEDRQACLSAASQQSQQACMQEAKAVRALPVEATPSVSPEQLQRHRLLRCAPLHGEDRQDCIARMQGQGTVSGSVAGGGVLRELVTHSVVSTPPQQAASGPTRP